MKLIAVDQIEEGMILAEDVLSDEGSVYLNAGIVLKSRHKVLLDNLQIMFVYVHEPKINPRVDLLIETQKHKVHPQDKALQQSFKKTIEAYKKVYASVTLGNTLVLNEVKSELEPLVSKVLENNDLLGTIRKIEIFDDYTYRHSLNVSMMVAMVGKWLNLPENEVYELSIAGLLHDIGKCKVPSMILNKPSKLNAEEFEIMKTHALLSYSIISESQPINENILRGVLEHHERVDGSGYPYGLTKDKIHLYARIIAVADMFDAMTSDRVYRGKLSPYTVADELLRAAYSHLDIEIVSIFVQNISRFFVGNEVELNTGEIGEVVLINKTAVTRPLIRLSHGFVDLSARYDLEISKVLGESTM
jgi:HD-GYP domain-containing protein (c-di-GMP phosphodiesterase class II)